MTSTLIQIALGAAAPLWLAALVAANSAAHVAGAGANPTPVALQPSVDDDPSRLRARILHLADGRSVRARARREGGQWIWRADGREVRVDAEQVVRVAVEADLLRTAARMRAELDSPGRDRDPNSERPTAPRRVAFAAWLVREGLVDEALSELDRVLAEAPDDERVAAFFDDELAHLRLATPSFPAREAASPTTPGAQSALKLPAEDDAAASERARLGLIGKGRLGTPSVRELAVRALARDPDPQALAAELARRLHDVSAKSRSFAAFAASRLVALDAPLPTASGRFADVLTIRALVDADADVRREMARGLARARNPELEREEPFLRALDNDSTLVRRHAADALAIVGTNRALAPLGARLAALNAPAAAAGGPRRPPRAHVFFGRQLAYVLDFDVEIAQGASIADPVIGVLSEGTVLDVAAYGATIEREVVLEARAVRGALAAIEARAGAAPALEPPLEPEDAAEDAAGGADPKAGGARDGSLSPGARRGARR